MRLKPVATWRTYRRNRIPNDLPIVPCAAEAIPAETASRLEACAAALRAAGFVHALDYGPRDPAAAILNHGHVLAHPAERIRAWIMDLESEYTVKTIVELATRYPDARSSRRTTRRRRRSSTGRRG